MELKELRIKKGLTQADCAKFLGISLRTYINYEKGSLKQNSLKYQYVLEKLRSYGFVDETHGVLSVENIADICKQILEKYDVEYCYLFGSYAKCTAGENSDVDLFISTGISGLKFFELAEELREALKKRVDVINQAQLKDNFQLANEILKDGVKIYG